MTTMQGQLRFISAQLGKNKTKQNKFLKLKFYHCLEEKKKKKKNVLDIIPTHWEHKPDSRRKSWTEETSA